MLLWIDPRFYVPHFDRGRKKKFGVSADLPDMAVSFVLFSLSTTSQSNVQHLFTSSSLSLLSLSVFFFLCFASSSRSPHEENSSGCAHGDQGRTHGDQGRIERLAGLDLPSFFPFFFFFGELGAPANG